MIELSDEDKARAVADRLAPNTDPFPSIIQQGRISAIGLPIYWISIKRLTEERVTFSVALGVCRDAGIPVAEVMSSSFDTFPIGIAIRARHAPKLVRLLNRRQP